MHRVDGSKEFVDRATAVEHFLKNIITSGGTWVYGSDVESKAQSSQWVSKSHPAPPPQSATSSVQCESDADFCLIVRA
jgi:hypothetical protein